MPCRFLILALALAVSWSAERLEIDRPVCTVNQAVITHGDVRELVQEHIRRLQARGQQPQTTDDLQALHRLALRELVDRELILQHAERLQVTIDRHQLHRTVLEEVSARGVGSDMLTVARMVEERESQARIEQVFQFYERSVPAPGPEDLREAYHTYRDRLQRPERLHLRQILLATSDRGLVEGLRRELLGLVRSVRGHRLPAIRSLVDEAFVDSAVETQGLAQVRLLFTVVDRLLADPRLAEHDPRLIDVARQLAAERGALRTREQAVVEAELLRGLVAAVAEPRHRQTLFAALAQVHSDDPDAWRSGDLGWVEPGTLSEGQRLAVADLPAGAVSQPFWMGQSCALLLVVERQEARIPSLAEVSVELEAMLIRQQRQKARERLLSHLHEQADIIFTEDAPAGS